MRHLNYSHLHYFWVVAREGSIAKASHTLHLTPQTISSQLKLLDEAVGQPLFNRVGRRLVMSEMGQMVFEYADEIFSVGQSLSPSGLSSRRSARTRPSASGVTKRHWSNCCPSSRYTNWISSFPTGHCRITWG